MAWHQVVETLEQVAPYWTTGNGTGAENACAAITQLSMQASRLQNACAVITDLKKKLTEIEAILQVKAFAVDALKNQEYRESIHSWKHNQEYIHRSQTETVTIMTSKARAWTASQRH